MAQTILITLTTAGTDTGPFDFYSDADGYVVPFETGVSKSALEAGYLSVLVPDAATVIRVMSDGVCTNSIDLVISTTTTTTTSTSTSTTSTTTTTTTSSTTTTTTTATPEYTASIYGNSEESILSGSVLIEYSLTNNGLDWASVGSAFTDTSCSLRGTVPNIPSGSTLYLRVVAGVSSPVEFGGSYGTSTCPGAGPNNNCIVSGVITSNTDVAITVNTSGGAVIGCP